MRLRSRVRHLRANKPSVHKLKGHMAPARVYQLNAERLEWEKTMAAIDDLPRQALAVAMGVIALILVPIALMFVLFVGTAVLHFFS
jgi:hypothetical protein